MTTLRIGVIRGGVSDEYPISLQTGGAVLRHLPAHYHPIDILIDKEGVWHCNGVPQSPERIFAHVDVIFNALHGYYGEDGKVQTLLEQYDMPYTGSDSLSSAIGMNKVLSKKVFGREGLKTPYYATVDQNDDAEEAARRLYRDMPKPIVVKPVDGGSSFGVVIAYTFNDLLAAIKDELQYSQQVLIEEYHDGKEVTCGVIDDFRGQEYYALPPVEIIPSAERQFFDYDAKYGGATQELCPAPSLSFEEKQAVMDMAVQAHQSLGLRHYSRSDFILTPSGIHILETNTLPGLTEESLIPKSVEVVGLSFPHLLDHLIQLAWRGQVGI